MITIQFTKELVAAILIVCGMLLTMHLCGATISQTTAYAAITGEMQ